MFSTYRIRQFTQVVTFILFICFLIYIDPLAEWDFVVNFFVRLSPLSAIGAMVASREFIFKFWPAFVLLISTVFIGRYFCSWVCPFGTTIDITDRFLSGKRKQRATVKGQCGDGQGKRSQFYDKRRIKYYVLVLLLVCSLFGLQMVGWFDPLSLVTNTYTILVHPYVVSVINSLLYCFYYLPFIGDVVKSLHEMFKVVLFAYHPPFFQYHFIFLFIFLAIISVGLFYRRYWCRNLCPLGAILALVSEWALFKRNVGDGCTSCRRCVANCGMGAISENGKGTLAGECTLCFTCQKVCKNGAVEFVKVQKVEQIVDIDLSKRKILTAGIAGTIAVPVIKLKSGKLLDSTNHLIIRPPGALNEKKFVAKCLRCGECMRVCKTNGLNPVVFQGNFSSFWTPTLVPRLGYCDYECTLCGKVCPSGAIKRLEKSVKQITVIGKAMVNRNRCIPWVGFAGLSNLNEEWKDVNCAVCEEVCPIPVKAIRFNPFVVSEGKEIRRVFVVEDLCIGCGFCEKVCPVAGEPAIRVEGIQPQILTKRLEISDGKGGKGGGVDGMFPETIGLWKLESMPRLYKGGNKLTEYINGGADPYLSFSFVQVTVANYVITNLQKSVKIDIWEFGSSDDAYGVFTKDRGGKAIEIGDGGAIYSNYLWVWVDRYFVSIEPQDGFDSISSGDVSLLGKTLVKGLSNGKTSKPPEIVDFLPAEGLNLHTIKYFHEKIILDNLYISSDYIEENVFGLSANTKVVVGEYNVGLNSPPFKVMVVEYDNYNNGEIVLKNLVKLRNEWGEQVVESEPFYTFSDNSNKYYSICQIDNLLVSTFFADSLQMTTKYVNAVLNIVKVDKMAF